METRDSTRTIVFRHPFALRSGTGVQPAGRYILNLEEEALDGPSFQAWQCVAMTLTRESASGLRQALPLSPAELAALRDADESGAP